MRILALWPAQAQHTIQSGPGRRPMARLRRPLSGVDGVNCGNGGSPSRSMTISRQVCRSVPTSLPGSTGSSVALLCIPVVAGADLGPSHKLRWYLALCLVPSCGVRE